MYNKIVLLIALLLTQFAFTQEQVRSKRQIVSMLNEAGNLLVNLECDKSLIKAKEALSYAHSLQDDVLMAKAYNIIGLNFSEFSDPKTAILYYEKGLKHASKTNNDSIKLWLNNNLGAVYAYQNVNSEKGITFYKKGVFYAQKIKDSIEITYCKLNICGAYFNDKNYAKGIPYLKSVEKYILKSNEIEAKISLYSKLGTYYNYKNELDKSESYYLKAIEIGKQNKSELVNSTICEIYSDFSALYKKKNDVKKALYYSELYNSTQKKIYSEEKTQNVKAVENQIQLEEYKRQINTIESQNHEQSKDLKESKLIVLLFVIILFILLLLLYSLFKNNNFREQTNRELKLANEELKSAKEKAEEASQLKTQFVSTISHELRTPLYGVVGITNIILDEHKELANSPHLNSLKFSARYLLSLVNDLLQINKIEENKITLENMIFNVSDEIKTIVDSLEFIAVKNNNKLTAVIDKNIPEFLIGDKLRLSQIFMNLVSNALKFTKDGEVIVTAKQDRIEGTKHFIYFSVKDNGVGIAIEDQEKIFEKFVQIERKEGDYQGTGLGLSIVQKLTELFDSKINIESKENVGTEFSFTIGFEADPNKKNEIINNIEVDLSSNHLYKILVVEDNKINQIVTRKILESNNFKCVILEDGYAALNLLEKETFDVILMDINMPIINGFDTTKLIRKKGFTTPVIALTAFDKQEITEQALSSGMNDIIIKPFEQAKLFQVINNLINKKNVD
ncbi:response regulator [Flavobacterium sp. SUN052]|uniref:response regulator n=1 Tax=Flavobacterium sp. SUN052 TaxID=3002441 RepID=UPI00237D4B4F|nr:response regulator [Flavobacterium sp. SUN052]MEC4005816.1 response regulator [Flavobacterium sp. SUN052]